jgi:uncharacterized protein (TIGR02145 family)
MEVLMKQNKAVILMLLVPVTVCLSQSFNLSGVVKNSQGGGIEGVMVRLGKVGLSTTTGTDGSFTLSRSINGIRHPAMHVTTRKGCPFILENNKIILNIVKQKEVNVMIYDYNGKLLLKNILVVSANNRSSVTLPHLSSGIYVFRVSMNSAEYTFKTFVGNSEFNQQITYRNSAAQDKQAKITTQIDDALLCTKEGYQLYRMAVSHTNTSGIAITMTPFVAGKVTDVDGNIYRTIQYGNQTWMVENLRTTKYNDATVIPLINDGDTWSTTQTPAYCYFDYTTDTAEQRKWGAFYNWYAVNTGKLAPMGWHVATNADWDTLQDYLIGNGYNYDGTTSENKIAKSLSVSTDWLESSDTGAIGNDSMKNNASDFSGLPNGYCEFTGLTYYRNWYAFWWTATEQDSTMVKIRCLSYYKSNLQSSAFTKNYGLSVRAVKNK